MNLIVDLLPDAVDIAGNQVKIVTDFRTGIIFEEMMLDDSLSDEEKLFTALQLYFPAITFDSEIVPEAIQAILWFYKCGQNNTASSGKEHTTFKEDPQYSYEHDADYIYAAFLSSFGIDLTQVTLHWWQFRALFRSLPEETQFIKIVGYRTMQIPAKMPKDQKQRYQKLKKLYALPVPEERQRLESDLTQLLMNGGNPSTLE